MALNKGFPASNLISPSIRIAERDLSFLTNTNVGGRAGLVGFASKGPINVPTLISSTSDLHTTFGWPHPDTGDPYLIYAAEQFLLAGTELYVVRVADTNQASADAATIASVEIPTAGGPVQIIGNIAVSSGFSFSEDNFFRWRLNGTLASKVLVVLADTNRPAPDTGLPYSMQDLVDNLNSQLVPGIDGILFDFDNKSPAGTPTSSSHVVVKSYFSYGPDALVELVSVTDSLYGPGSIVGLGTTMTPAILTGTSDQYPETSVPAPGTWDFSSFASGSLVLEIVTNGTNNILIDNVVQSVVLNSTVQTTTDIANTINDAISNGDIPGGFVASSAADFLRVSTTQFGRDARIFVKPTSSAAPYLGFTGGSAVGTSPTAVTGSGGTYAAGIVSGDPNSTGELCFTVQADSPGIDGNATQLVITNSTSDGTFTIDVYSYNQQVEIHGGLSKNPLNFRYLETYINQNSNYISIVDNTDNAALPAPSSEATPYSLEGGSDGLPSNPDDQDSLLIGSQIAMSGLMSLSDPEQIDIELIAIPGHASTDVALAIINLCENIRSDCFGIIEPPFGLSVTEIVQWQNGVHPLNDVRFDSSFAALYWPWVKIRDGFNRISVWVPPSGNVLATFAQNDTIAAPWFPAAGLNRGRVPGVLSVFTNPTLAERDQMYGSANAVNPIIEFVGQEGFYIWGNKTLQRAESALDRINVRRMMFYVEKQIGQAAKILLFEPHTASLRSAFVQIASGILDRVKSGDGLLDYIVQCDSILNTPDVIDRNELRAKIAIQPTRAVEFIFIEFTVTRTGSFTETTATF